MFREASPLVRGVIYTMIAIMATAETYTYSIWIWRKLYPPSTDQQVESGGETED
jgi:hypothetical protein